MTKNFKILHFVQDEKFTDVAIELFESAYPRQNRYLVGKSILNRSLIHIKSKVERVYLHRFSAAYLARIADHADLVFFHGLGTIHGQIFSQLKNKSKAVCLFYGAEIYNNPTVYPISILGPKTEALSQKTHKPNPQNWLRKLMYGDLFMVKDEAQMFRTLKHFGSLFHEEMLQLQSQKILSKDCSHFSFAFGYLEQFPPISMDVIKDKNYILLGNSASATNNHLELFDKLESCQSELPILVPLSYGDAAYRTKIMEAGKRVFGDRFEPIIDFKDFESYHTLLQQCRIAIFNHYRQQALGNILSLLWLGAKVYLSEKNPISHALIKAGFTIFLIEKDFESEDFQPLSPTITERNQLLLRQIFSKDQIIAGIRTSVERMRDSERVLKENRS